jgi:hypothetical protein
MLNKKALNCTVPYYKLLNLLKAFQAVEIGPGRLSKVAGAVLPAFQKRIVYRKHVEGLKIGKIGSGRLLKVHGAAPRNPLSHRRKVKLASRLSKALGKL